MDREPFATYRTYPRGLMADGFVDGKQYAYLSVTQAKHQIPIINDAHEARVKEAVREAVDERDARIAELERVLEKIVEKSQNPYRDRHHECDSRLALQSIHDSAKSVLGKKEAKP